MEQQAVQVANNLLLAGWFVSVLILVATLWVVARMSRLRGKERNRATLWAAYSVGTFVSVFALVLTQRLAGILEPTSAPPVVDSLFQTLTMFLVNRGMEPGPEALEPLGSLAGAYAFYNGLTYLLAPVGTLGTVVSLIDGLFRYPKIRYLSHRYDTFAFSELNRRSLLLGQSIRKHYEGRGEKCLIVFADVDDQSSEELLDEARGRFTLFSPESLPGLRRLLDGSSHRTCYLFAGEDELDNLDRGVGLADDLAEVRRANDGWGPIRVMIFSSAEVAGPLVDAVMEKVDHECAGGPLPIEVQRVDWVRSTVDSLLSRYPLFLVGEANTYGAPEPAGDGAVASGASAAASDDGAPVHPAPLGGGSADAATGGRFVGKAAAPAAGPSEIPPLYFLSHRRVLVIGSTDLAFAYLKSAVWAACLGPEVEVSIDVVAPDAFSLRERLAFDAPELLDGRSDRDYRISFMNMDPECSEFASYLRRVSAELTFVLVDRGDDLQSSKLAMRVRQITEQQLVMRAAGTGLAGPDAGEAAQALLRPVVCAVVRSDPLADAMTTLHAGRLPYDVHAVGTDRGIYSYQNVFNPVLEAYARGVNRAYWGLYAADGSLTGDPGQADRGLVVSEYNRRSSAASAIHLKYGLFVYCRYLLLGLHGVPRDQRALDALTEGIDWSKPAGELDHRLLEAYTDYITHELEPRDARGRAALARQNWRCRLEHDRWNAYTRADGYERAGAEEVRAYYACTGKNRNDLARLHNCLVATDDLPQVDREFEPLSRSMSRAFEPYELADVEVVEHMSSIVRTR